VYILRSVRRPGETYIGVTGDLRRRLRQHNAGQSEYTKRFIPWKIETYIAFSDAEKARAFERYLKRGGGWRFAQRRLM
jgi:predicted GIY-YIG superfamily endonuclease